MTKRSSFAWILALAMLLVLGGVAFTYHYFFEKHEYPTFERLDNIRFETLSLQPKLELGFQADAVFHNPSPFSIDISALFCEVFVDGKKTTTIRQTLSQTMPANSEFTLPFQFDLPLQSGNVLKDIGQVLSGAWAKKSVQIRFNGTITVSIAQVSQLSLDLPFEEVSEYRLSDYLKQERD